MGRADVSSALFCLGHCFQTGIVAVFKSRENLAMTESRSRISESPLWSRRRFLQTVGTGSALGLLAACGQPRQFLGRFRAEPTPEMRAFHLLIGEGFDFIFDIETLKQPWEEEFPHWPLTVHTRGLDALGNAVFSDASQGQDTFDGVIAVFMPLNLHDFLAGIQPWDPFVEESAVPGADQVLPALPRPVRDAASDRGQLMGLPISVSSVSLAWLTAPLDEAGMDSVPVSWEETWLAAQVLKDTTSLVPFDRLLSPTGDLLAMIWGGADEPYTSDGIVDWEGEIAILALQWLQDMVQAELMPEQERGFEAWMDGRIGIMSGMDLHGALAQSTLGPEAAVTGTNMRLQRDRPAAGTPFWTNTMVIPRTARNPQAAADFGLWWLGPEDIARQKRIADMAPKPAYDYVYADSLMQDSRYAWQQQAMEFVKTSVPIRSTPAWSAELEIIGRWMAQALNWETGISARDALTAGMSEIRALRNA